MERETHGYVPTGESAVDLPFEMEGDELSPDVLTPENTAKISDAAKNLQTGQALEAARQNAEKAAIENDVENAFDNIQQQDEGVTELGEDDIKEDEDEDIEQAS